MKKLIPERGIRTEGNKYISEVYADLIEVVKEDKND